MHELLKKYCQKKWKWYFVIKEIQEKNQNDLSVKFDLLFSKNNYYIFKSMVKDLKILIRGNRNEKML